MYSEIVYFMKESNCEKGMQTWNLGGTIVFGMTLKWPFILSYTSAETTRTLHGTFAKLQKWWSEDKIIVVHWNDCDLPVCMHMRWAIIG